MEEYVILNGEKIVVKDGVLSLKKKKIAKISEIKGIENLKTVRTLDLTRNKIEYIEGLDSLVNLKNLNLSMNNINSIRNLDSLSELEELNLERNNIGFISGLENNQKLQKLNLARNNINNIQSLAILKNLQEINLEGNNITEINGLNKIKNLRRIILNKNKISEIKGLFGLSDLKTLLLRDNQIFQIQKLDSLKNLQYLNLEGNQISEIKGLGDLNKLFSLNLSHNKISEIKDLENLKKLFILNLESNCLKEVKGLENLNDLTHLFLGENEIPEEILNFGGGLSYDPGYKAHRIKNPKGLIAYCRNKKSQEVVKTHISTQPKIEENVQPLFNLEKIEILRGGDWRVEGGQSIFYFKVKIKNNSLFIIANIQILLTSIPRGLESVSERYKIENLKPGSFESPTFKLLAKESCVGDTIEGLVTLTGPMGKLQTIPIEPFEICYVCNLLQAKPVSREEYDQKTEFMEEKKLVIDSSFDIQALQDFISKKFDECHFALLEDLKAVQSDSFLKIEGFAQGIYDKQDVALSVAVQKMEDGSKLVVKAMSDKNDKVTDLLRDFSVKLDDIKSDTELIKEYTSQIDNLFDKFEQKLDDLEDFLIDKLGSDWDQVKDTWKDYKEGKINRKQMVLKFLKQAGKKVIKKMISTAI